MQIVKDCSWRGFGQKQLMHMPYLYERQIYIESEEKNKYSNNQQLSGIVADR